MTARDYLNRLVTLARLQETGADAHNLLEYLRATLPGVAPDDFIETFQVLECTVNYCVAYSTWEDELQPIISIFHALRIFCGEELVSDCDLAMIKAKSDARVASGHEPWPKADENTYEAWCDKFAEHLA